MPIPTGPQDSTQFDFITGGSSLKHSASMGTGGTATKRIALVVGGFIVLAIIGWVFISIVTKPVGIDPAALLDLAQKQTELARISQTPALTAVQQPTQDFAETTYMTMLTNQVAFVKYMGDHGATKPSNKTLNATKNSQTDTTLQSAQATGTYDSTYISIAKTQLTAYEQALSRAFSASKSTSERQMLQSAYTQAQMLVTMSSQQY